MIVNLPKKPILKVLNMVSLFVKKIRNDIGIHFQATKAFNDSIELKKFFKINHPILKVDALGNVACVSCGLCESVCPTDAIKIDKANMVNFPVSLTTGESPLHFYLDVSQCIKCGLCADICYVEALDLNAYYKVTKVDLVAEVSN